MVLEIHYNNCKTHKTSIDTWFKLTFNNSIILTIINISSSRITCFISYALTRRHTTSFQRRYDVVVCLQGIQGNSLIIIVLTRSFIMLNTMRENKSKSFTIMSIWDIDRNHGIYFLFPSWYVKRWSF